MVTYPQLNALNIMALHSPTSAVLSAVIFNALVIVALIPLALRGVKFRPASSASILRRNVFIYGVGGIITPFIFIKLIDLILVAAPLVLERPTDVAKPPPFNRLRRGRPRDHLRLRSPGYRSSRSSSSRARRTGPLRPTGQPLSGRTGRYARCPGHPLGSCVFHGRPDDTGPYAASKTQSGGDNPLVANGVPGESSATNLGPRSSVLLKYTRELVAYWHKLGVDPTADLVTTSGSGLDPDITPQDATVQIPMVPRATGITPSVLRKLIARETHSAEWGFLGSKYIVVLQLNEALAKLH